MLYAAFTKLNLKSVALSALLGLSIISVVSTAARAQTWEVVQAPSSEQLTGICALGSDTLPWFFDIEMFDRKHGIVIGSTREEANRVAGIGLRTADGGKTWTKMPPLGMGYSEAGSLSPAYAYFVSFGKIHISRDGGKTWDTFTTHDGSPARSIAMDDATGIMAGPNGMVSLSNDSGKTWTANKQNYDAAYIKVVQVNNKVAYIGGVNTPILRTGDGGRTWKGEDGTDHFQIFDMCVTPGDIWAVGTKGLLVHKKLE